MVLEQKGLHGVLTFHFSPQDLLWASFFPPPGCCIIAVVGGALPHGGKFLCERQHSGSGSSLHPAKWHHRDHRALWCFLRLWGMLWASEWCGLKKHCGPFSETEITAVQTIWGSPLAFCGKFVGFCVLLVAHSQSMTNHWLVISAL